MPPSAEDRLIDWLTRELRRRDLPVLIGDDTASVSLEGQYAVTSDQQIEGTHFRDLEAAAIGRRLVRVNLSDLAANGATPAFGTLTIAAPPSFDFKALFRGVLDTCQEFALTLAGGDVGRARAVTATMTVCGRLPGPGLGRHLAEPGDQIWVSGSVGESALGRLLLGLGARVKGRSVRFPSELSLSPSLERAARAAVRRHLLPQPELALGSQLARRQRVAAIDISDGLLLDLERLARASGVGCRLDAPSVPTVRLFAELAAVVRRNPMSLALSGGEDYVLAFTLPSRSRPPKGFGARRIGEIVAGSGLELVGHRLPVQRGWDHLR